MGCSRMGGMGVAGRRHSNNKETSRCAPAIPETSFFAAFQSIVEAALLQEFHDHPNVVLLEAHSMKLHNVPAVTAAENCNLCL